MSDPQLSPTSRKNTIAAIWTGAKQLNLSKTELYRLVEAWTGETSMRQMTDAQLIEVVENLRKMGFEKPDGDLAILQDDRPQVKKIKALWLELRRHGAVESAHMNALNAYVRRMTSVSHVNWLTPKDANGVIESLKQWRDRLSNDQQ